MLWLRNGIAGDDTHGHVDDLARFVNPTTVVTVVEAGSPRRQLCSAAGKSRAAEVHERQDGRAFRVETLPMPAPVYFDGQRLPASYANFYIANKLVIVPTFNDANDRVALNTLADLFPGREVVGIACRDLVLGLGTIHCMTQQQPADSELAPVKLQPAQRRFPDRPRGRLSVNPRRPEQRRDPSQPASWYFLAATLQCASNAILIPAFPSGDRMLARFSLTFFRNASSFSRMRNAA